MRPMLSLTTLPLIALAVMLSSSSHIFGQGFYEKQLRRNPYTGRLEVVRNGNAVQRWAGPANPYRSFYGAQFNPYTGTAVQSRVQRNPFTGRLEVDNQYYNLGTGAQMATSQRFNPFTQRYETGQIVVPPSLPLADAAAAPPAPPETKKPLTPPRPRVIETNPADFAPPDGASVK